MKTARCFVYDAIEGNHQNDTEKTQVSKTDSQKPKKQGRPETRVLMIDASPEYVMKATFAVGEPDSGKASSQWLW